MKKPLVTDLQRELASDEKGSPKRELGSGYPVKTGVKAGEEEVETRASGGDGVLKE